MTTKTMILKLEMILSSGHHNRVRAVQLHMIIYIEELVLMKGFGCINIFFQARIIQVLIDKKGGGDLNIFYFTHLSERYRKYALNNARLTSIVEHEYSKVLTQVNASIQKIGDGCVEIDIPDELLILHFDNPIEAIVSSTYPDLHLHYNDEQFLQYQINEYVLSIILGEEKEYLSSDSVDMSDVSDIEVVNVLTPEFLSKLSTSSIPNHKIKLKIGTPIMLLRNLDLSEGLCNGIRLIVTQMANHVLEAKIMSDKNVGNIIYILRMSISPSQTQWPFKLIRRQFPIIVSYAMTINKSHGQSLENVGLYLPKPVFNHGQLYVTISRVKSKNGLKILIHDKDGIPLKSTTNVVYKEVFQKL
ncbi:hypothetical protein Lal_00021239 [Lupinus albus]|nr:hypothetical protein Lal_00021239 [Lupinus albus]